MKVCFESRFHFDKERRTLIAYISGSLDTMRHLKKEVTELRKGTECGLSLGDFDLVQVGDMIQSYENVESPGSL